MLLELSSKSDVSVVLGVILGVVSLLLTAYNTVGRNLPIVQQIIGQYTGR